MEYPINGSVVIVDDKPEEIEGLIRVLASKGVPTLYFNEDIDKISTLNGIRIIFLDLDLKIGVQDTPEPAIISTAIAVLNKLIVQNNGGYILVLWSTLIENYADAVIKVLNDGKEGKISLLKEYPIDIIKLDKNQVSTKNGTKLDFDIDLIYQKINSLIPENNILNLINYWENIVVHSSKKVINNFDNVAKKADDKKELLALFADSISQTDNLTAANIINPSLAPISALLSDQLNSYKNVVNLTPIGHELIKYLNDIKTKKQKILNTSQAADINTFYHIDTLSEEHFAPGSVYNYDDYMSNFSCSANDCNREWAKNLKEPMLIDIKIKVDKYIKLQKGNEQHSVTDSEREGKQFNIKDNVIPLFLEFTPDCDYVQGKRKKLRLIFGLMYPVEDGISINLDQKDYYVSLPLINYKEKQYNIILNLLTVTGINQNKFANATSIFRLRKELLVDIQQKIASHIARPGFFNMNDYLK